MKKNNIGAFEEAAALLFQDVFYKIKAELSGTPYIPLDLPKSTYYTLEALEDHTRHIDAGIGGASVPVKAGDIITTQDISIHSLDISKYRLLNVQHK